jgi:pimeloyl-ACP methyl ester carboxylesterase
MVLVTFFVVACTRTSPNASTSPTPTFAVGSITWTGCDKGFQCGNLMVPLDYSHPAGRKVTLALIKKPKQGAQPRIGSLLYNPGGPGESGVDYLRDDPSIKDLNQRFDIVAWDPRGIGGSTRISCVDNATLDRDLALDGVLDDPAEKAATVQADKDFVDGCQRRSGFLLPFMDSATTARDMDQIRAALGDAKLTYIGFSYGTLLGQWYAHLFPTHVRALSLDGVVDPGVSANESQLRQVVGFEQNLQAFLTDCRSRTSCVFGRSGDPAAKLNDLMARLDKTPINVGSRQLTRNLAMTGLLQTLYDQSLWTYLDQGLVAAQNGDGRILLFFADYYNKRNSDGTYDALANGGFAAVFCVDFPSTSDIAYYDSLGPSYEKASPFFGEWFQYGNLLCGDWPVKLKGSHTPLPIQGAPPILLVGGTNDPATPYVDAQSVNRQISGSILLTRQGNGHTSYGSSACSHAAEDAYLIDLTIPAAGTTCSS